MKAFPVGEVENKDKLSSAGAAGCYAELGKISGTFVKQFGMGGDICSTHSNLSGFCRTLIDTGYRGDFGLKRLVPMKCNILSHPGPHT